MVHGLTPGESYTFRVQAVNVFGLSDESQESSPIAVEPALGKTTHSHPANRNSGRLNQSYVTFPYVMLSVAPLFRPGQGVQYGTYSTSLLLLPPD